MRQILPRSGPRSIVLPPLLGGVVASATSIGGRAVQQDACFHASLPGAKILIVADGIGEMADSDLIASRAVLDTYQFLSTIVGMGEAITETVLRRSFIVAAEDARALNRELKRRGEAGGGSTLIVAVETADYFYVAAAGDGAVVFVDGRSKVIRNALVGQAGRKIRGYIGSDAVHPTLLSYPKTNPDGHCLFIATDGIATSLQNRDPRRVRDEVRETTTIALILEEIRSALIGDDWKQNTTLSLLVDWVEGRRSQVMGGGETWRVSYAQDNRSIGVLVDEAFIQAGRRR
jgi:serine/threonine protein phosphatase PrpC